LHLTVVLLIEEVINGKRSTFHTARHSAFVSVKERMNTLADSGEGTGPHVVVAAPGQKKLQCPLKFLMLILSPNWAGKGQFIEAIVLVVKDDVPGHFRMLA
jgi:hypothetical protein